LNSIGDCFYCFFRPTGKPALPRLHFLQFRQHFCADIFMTAAVCAMQKPSNQSPSNIKLQTPATSSEVAMEKLKPPSRNCRLAFRRCLPALYLPE
jgi:hypothetical protein